MLVDGTPAVVKNILRSYKAIVLICVHFKKVLEAFNYPLPSSQLSIFSVKGQSTDFFAASVSE